MKSLNVTFLQQRSNAPTFDEIGSTSESEIYLYIYFLIYTSRQNYPDLVELTA